MPPRAPFAVALLAAILWSSAAARARADDDAICADRPTKADAPCTVPAGRWQVEAGVFDGQFQRQDGVTTDTWTVADPVLKYGLTDRLDLEAELPLFNDVRMHDAFGSDHAEGIGDLRLAAKFSLTGNGGKLTAALEPYVLAPTAPRSIGAGGFEGGLQAPVAYKLTDKWSIDTMPEVDVVRNDDGGGSHAQTIQLVGVNAQVTDALTLSAELWSQWDLSGGGRLDEASADLAAAYVIGKTLQLDGGVNVGLNRRTPGAEVYAGVSKRF